MNNINYYSSVGRRKSAHCYIKLFKGKGDITINNKNVSDNAIIQEPMKIVGELGKWNIEAKVNGGGYIAQQEAISLGVSRALVKINSEYKKTLKKHGLLTRDSREKERMKPGLKSARKAPQWSKR